MQEADRLPRYSFRNLLWYFVRLGTTGFGGPIALVGYMHRDLVEARQWITEEQYRRGLALAQLAPGPLAAQLAIYIGVVKRRILGATLVGFAFILPSFVMVVIIGVFYKLYGGLEWMQGAFYGIGAAVIGIIVKSAYKLATSTLKKRILLWAIFSALFIVTAFTEEEMVWLFLLSGFVALVIQAPPRFLSKTYGIMPAMILMVGESLRLPRLDLLGKIFLYFAKAGTFVFGSGLAIVPFLHGGVVQDFHWLNERQFLDAVAVAMITPGPVVITVGFIGYLVADLPGAIAAALGVFLPVYLFVVVPAPYIERYAHNQKLVAFVDGVTAAATGAIAGAVVVLGRRAITDVPSGLIAASTLALFVRFKIPEPLIIVGAAIVGLLLYQFTQS
jgi:chromate transporter